MIPKIGGDYAEYKEIIGKVSNIDADGTITKSTFIDILNWKAPRVKDKVRLSNFPIKDFNEFFYYSGYIKVKSRTSEMSNYYD